MSDQKDQKEKPEATTNWWIKAASFPWVLLHAERVNKQNNSKIDGPCFLVNTKTVDLSTLAAQQKVFDALFEKDDYRAMFTLRVTLKYGGTLGVVLSHLAGAPTVNDKTGQPSGAEQTRQKQLDEAFRMAEALSTNDGCDTVYAVFDTNAGTDDQKAYAAIAEKHKMRFLNVPSKKDPKEETTSNYAEGAPTHVDTKANPNPIDAMAILASKWNDQSSVVHYTPSSVGSWSAQDAAPYLGKEDTAAKSVRISIRDQMDRFEVDWVGHMADHVKLQHQRVAFMNVLAHEHTFNNTPNRKLELEEQKISRWKVLANILADLQYTVDVVALAEFTPSLAEWLLTQRLVFDPMPVRTEWMRLRALSAHNTKRLNKSIDAEPLSEADKRALTAENIQALHMIIVKQRSKAKEEQRIGILVRGKQLGMSKEHSKTVYCPCSTCQIVPVATGQAVGGEQGTAAASASKDTAST